jgi:predicted metal-dependent phosphoesterase TrpH
MKAIKKRGLAMKHILVITGILLTTTMAGYAQNWYRGSLHGHSYWSDGNTFPELAIHEYKANGYQFMCLSDHNAFQTDTNAWKEIKDSKSSIPANIALMERTFGQDSVRTKSKIKRINVPLGEGEMKLVEKEVISHIRLTPFDELARKFDEPEKFLLMPGHEINKSAGGRTLHSNALNIRTSQPFIQKETIPEAIQAQLDGLRQIEEASKAPNLLMVNHPSWPFYDIDPEMLAEVRDLQLYELCNVSAAPAAHEISNRLWTCESFFDILTTLRLKKGWDPVYGTVTDDVHNYNPDRKPTDINKDYPLQGWVMVRAKELTTTALIEALNKGDFYASTGVTLDILDFNPATKTLSIKVKPEPGVTYTIRFNGSPKDVNIVAQETEEDVHLKKEIKKRHVRNYEKRLGHVLLTTEGTEASYTLRETDLYVRATITSSKKALPPESYEPALETAWTQPYYVK